jgi:hypothetical protein
MLKRILATLFYGACTVALLSSCGDSKAGGTGEFATVSATANPLVTNLDSDVAQWVDSKGASVPACSYNGSPSIKPDDVTYNITSTAYTSPNTGQTSPIAVSNLVITKVTVTLTPANSNTPALPAIYQTQFPTSGQTILPGNNTVTVRIVSDALKTFFIDNLGVICGNPVVPYSYRAVVSFEAVEVNTDRVSTIKAPGFLQVDVADFADK